MGIQIVDSKSMEFQKSPSPLVLRKRLEHSGPRESGRVTSIVRYAPNSEFPAHNHPDGEEILVLEGTFSDESGDYPAGTHVLNPSGSAHSPFSEDGCLLFVKLRQYPVTSIPSRITRPSDRKWLEVSKGHSEALLCKRERLVSEGGRVEETKLVRLDSSYSAKLVTIPYDEEIFVVSGNLLDENGTYSQGTWLRFPPGTAHTPDTESSALLYVKKVVDQNQK